MAKRHKKTPKEQPSRERRKNEVPPGATRKALDRSLNPGGGPPGSGAGPRHAADDVGSEAETFGAVDDVRTPASPPADEANPLEEGPPYAGRSGGAVGGTPAQLRSSQRLPRPESETQQSPNAVASPQTQLPPEAKRASTTLRLTGFAAIEYAEKQSLLLNKHPDSITGPRVGLNVAEAQAIADEDPDLIWLDVAKEDYYGGPPSSYEPEY